MSFPSLLPSPLQLLAREAKKPAPPSLLEQERELLVLLKDASRCVASSASMPDRPASGIEESSDDDSTD